MSEKNETTKRVAREAQEAEAERLKAEALKPQKDAVRAWAGSTLAGIPALPDIDDEAMYNRMAFVVLMIRKHLRDLENDMA